MGGPKPLALTLVALATAAAGAWPASGQCRLCDKPTTALGESQGNERIDLRVETSIDFGRLMLSGPGQGAAVIRPDGSNADEGALALPHAASTPRSPRGREPSSRRHARRNRPR